MRADAGSRKEQKARLLFKDLADVGQVHLMTKGVQEAAVRRGPYKQTLSVQPNSKDL